MPRPSVPPVIFILSGGVGSSGEHLVNTVLAQFPENSVQTHTVGNIRHPEQVSRAITQAKRANALVVYTLVDESLRKQVMAETDVMCVRAIDLMGPLIGWISAALEMEPLQQPGKYRQLHQEYYDRADHWSRTAAGVPPPATGAFGRERGIGF